MICLTVADLVLVAGRVLGRGTGDVLRLVDLDAAEAVLARVRARAAGATPAATAAALLHGLVAGQVVAGGNRRVAVAMVLQFAGLNGWDLDLEPVDEVRATLAGVAGGSVDEAALARWLAPRLLQLGTCRQGKELGMLQRFGKRERASAHGSGSGRLFQRFTERARSVVRLAQEAAADLGHNYIGTEHLLLGLLAEGEGVAARALATVGVEREAVQRRVEEIIGPGQSTPAGPVPFTPRSKKVLELALREALHLGHKFVGTEHLLLAILTEGKGLAAQVLAEVTDFEPIRENVLEQLDGAASKALYAEVARLLNDRPSPLAETLSGSKQRRERLLDELSGVFGELERLQVDNARLRGLLRRHGVDPGGTTSQSA